MITHKRGAFLAEGTPFVYFAKLNESEFFAEVEKLTLKTYEEFNVNQKKHKAALLFVFDEAKSTNDAQKTDQNQKGEVGYVEISRKIYR